MNDQNLQTKADEGDDEWDGGAVNDVITTTAPEATPSPEAQTTSSDVQKDAATADKWDGEGAIIAATLAEAKALPGHEVTAASMTKPSQVESGEAIGVFDGAAWDGDEATLPSDLNELFKLQVFYFGTLHRHQFTKSEFIECNRRRELLSKKLNSAFSGLPKIEIARPIFDRDRHFTRAEKRAVILKKLNEAMANNFFSSAPLRFPEWLDNFIAAAFTGSDSSPGLLFAASKLRRMAAEYAISYYSTYPQIFILDRIEEIKLALGTAASLKPNELADLHGELLKLESSGAQIVADSIRSKLIQEFKEIQVASNTVKVLVLFAVQNMKKEAESAERDFFSKFGLAHQPTRASSRFDETLKRLQSGIEIVTRPTPHNLHPPDPHHAMVFGIEILPGFP